MTNSPNRLPPARVQILELIAVQPQLDQGEISRAIGVTQQRVSQILAEEGYEQRWTKKEEVPSE